MISLSKTAVVMCALDTARKPFFIVILYSKLIILMASLNVKYKILCS